MPGWCVVGSPRRLRNGTGRRWAEWAVERVTIHSAKTPKLPASVRRTRPSCRGVSKIQTFRCLKTIAAAAALFAGFGIGSPFHAIVPLSVFLPECQLRGLRNRGRPGQLRRGGRTDAAGLSAQHPDHRGTLRVVQLRRGQSGRSVDRCGRLGDQLDDRAVQRGVCDSGREHRRHPGPPSLKSKNYGAAFSAVSSNHRFSS